MLNLCNTDEADEPHYVYYHTDTIHLALIKKCKNFKEANDFIRRKSIMVPEEHIFIMSETRWLALS